MADIFVSYTSSDRDWAYWIGKELQALGHVPHMHEWEISGSGDIYDWMERRLETADHVLCVVSDDYLKAPYSTLERKDALWHAASARPSFVLFIVVKQCKLPTLVDRIRRCELFGLAEDAARLRLREFMQKQTTPSAPCRASFPASATAKPENLAASGGIDFDVFISYPHQNKVTADAACAKLEAAGIRCWIAPRDVPPGTEWAAAIVDAIDRCRAVVLIFSSSANGSKQIRREVQQAFDAEKPVVPFRIEDVTPEKALRYYLGSVHWLDALTPPLEEHLRRLVSSVNGFVRPLAS